MTSLAKLVHKGAMKQRGARFLKFIVVYKALTGISALVMSILFFKLRNGNLPEMLAGFADRNNLVGNPVIRLAVKESSLVTSGELTGLAALSLGIGVIDIIEAIGLHLRRRWAEWMTVLLTAIFIPFEIYEMFLKASVLKAAVIVINFAIVYYLARASELFGAAQDMK